jgi:hypothetical protein
MEVNRGNVILELCNCILLSFQFSIKLLKHILFNKCKYQHE